MVRSRAISVRHNYNMNRVIYIICIYLRDVHNTNRKRCSISRGPIVLWHSGGLSHFLMSVFGYIRIYLAVYGPENKGGFGLEEKTKEVCGLGRTNYAGLQNVPSSLNFASSAGNKNYIR